MDRLKALRMNKHMTQKEIAAIIGVAQTTYSTWELGKFQPDNDSLIKLADFFGVSVDYLLGRNTPRDKDPVCSIGEMIRLCRERQGMTQEELAQRLGYKSKTSINKIELGFNDIPLSKISDFADALNTTVPFLMGWDNTAAAAPLEKDIQQRIAALLRDIEHTADMTFAGDPVDQRTKRLISTSLNHLLDLVAITKD